MESESVQKSIKELNDSSEEMDQNTELSFDNMMSPSKQAPFDFTPPTEASKQNYQPIFSSFSYCRRFPVISGDIDPHQKMEIKELKNRISR